MIPTDKETSNHTEYASVRGNASLRPRVLVLLAAYNGMPWITEQIDSIIHQTDVDVTIFVSDDGSVDQTREILAKTFDGSNMKLLAAEPPTGSASQNFFSLIRRVPAQDCDFVAFADQDDIWDHDRLFRACSLLKEHNASGYSSGVRAFWQSGKTSVISPNNRITKSDFLFESAGQGCTYVITCDFYERIRSLLVQHTVDTNQLRYHDWAIYALCRIWNLRWAFDRGPTVEYRQHANNDTGARSGVGGISKRLALIRTGWYRTQIHSVANFCAMVSPSDETVSRLIYLMSRSRSLNRTIHLALLCMRGGRRRFLDNTVLLAAILAGYV